MINKKLTSNKSPSLAKGGTAGRGGVVAIVICTLAVSVAYADPDPRYQRVTSQAYVDDAVADKQAKIGAESGDYVVVYPNSTGGDTAHDEAGEINKRAIVTSLSGASDALPTVGAVNTGLNDKQQKLSGTSGDLVTYGATTGTVGSQKIYNSGSAYTNQQQYLVQAQHVNSAVADGFSKHITCVSWLGDVHDDAHCLGWQINSNMASGTYVPEPAAGN